MRFTLTRRRASGNTKVATADANHAVDAVRDAPTAGKKRAGEMLCVVLVIALALFLIRRGLVERERAAAAAAASMAATGPYGIGTLYGGLDTPGSTSTEAAPLPRGPSTATDVLEPPPEHIPDEPSERDGD